MDFFILCVYFFLSLTNLTIITLTSFSSISSLSLSSHYNTEVLLCSFVGVKLPTMLMFLVFLHLLLDICGNTSWFSPLMALIFELCLFCLMQCLLLQSILISLCWVGPRTLFCSQGLGNSPG